MCVYLFLLGFCKKKCLYFHKKTIIPRHRIFVRFFFKIKFEFVVHTCILHFCIYYFGMVSKKKCFKKKRMDKINLNKENQNNNKSIHFSLNRIKAPHFYWVALLIYCCFFFIKTKRFGFVCYVIPLKYILLY